MTDDQKLEAFDDTGDDVDFANEHEQTVVEPDADGETESPDNWAEGLEGAGPP